MRSNTFALFGCLGAFALMYLIIELIKTVLLNVEKNFAFGVILGFPMVMGLLVIIILLMTETNRSGKEDDD